MPKGRKKLSETEKLQRTQKRDVRSVLRGCGFIRFSDASEQEIRFREFGSDIDDLFICENVLLLIEYTVHASSKISSHLGEKKAHLYREILENPEEFMDYLKAHFKHFATFWGEKFSEDQAIFKIVYCSENLVPSDLKRKFHFLKFLEKPSLKYFVSLSNSIKKSTQYEFIDFLGIQFSDFGDQVVSGRLPQSQPYEGHILPEHHSDFPKGYKVLSFYTDPAALLKRCYVLRRDGWQQGQSLYQRMIQKGKIENIRKYLVSEKRVFINNIIVTLPPETRITKTDGTHFQKKEMKKPEAVHLTLPDKFNSIGIIDGQHRVFSYHEGGKFDEKISILRTRQNLLVTGIVYPDGMDDLEKTKFEAKLFREINSTQTTAQGELLQEIDLLLAPYGAISIAKDVLGNINESGPLQDQFQRYFYESDKLKTTSIVSYGLRHIIKYDGKDSFFYHWDDAEKDCVRRESSEEKRKQYVIYCSNQLNQFFSAVKAHIPDEKWTGNPKADSRFLNTTTINGFIRCLRKELEVSGPISFSAAKNKLDGIYNFEFDTFKSSQYNKLGLEIHKRFFAS